MKIVFKCLFLIFSCQILWAQIIIPAKEKFDIDFDVAQFYGDSARQYIELYYGVRERVLSYNHSTEKYLGGALFTLNVWNGNTLTTTKEWTVPHSLEDTGQLAGGNTMVGIQGLGLSPGNYRFELHSNDIVDESRKDSMVFPLTVNLYPDNKIAISDLELSSSVTPSENKQSLFYKNTFEVIPNPGLLYGAGLPILFYYAEIYNMLTNFPVDNGMIRSEIFDGSGNEAFRNQKGKQRSNNASVEVDKINVSALGSGTYVLKISLVDSMENTYAVSTKKFFVYNPGVAREISQSSTQHTVSPEYMTMTEDQLDKEFELAQYLAYENEKDQYQLLHDVAAKRQFLTLFWQKRDSNPVTAFNEFRDDYLKRKSYVDANFSGAFRNGVKTDRGRVYMLYGQYDDIDGSPSSSETNPFEIWHYNNLQGGAIFVFVDKNDIGDYVLVHSTLRGEILDEQWFQKYARKAR